MRIRIFWKENCPNCPVAKELGAILENDNIKVDYFNIGEVNGLAEAAFFGVLSVPSVLVTKDKVVLSSWGSSVPSAEEVKDALLSYESDMQAAGEEGSSSGIPIEFAKVGSAWVKKASDGSKYISVSVSVNRDKLHFNLFRNSNKRESSHPDYLASGKDDYLKRLAVKAPEHGSDTEYIIFGAGWERQIRDTNNKLVSVSFELQGSIVYMNLLPNTFKEKEKHPDYNVSMERELASCLGFDIYRSDGND